MADEPIFDIGGAVWNARSQTVIGTATNTLPTGDIGPAIEGFMSAKASALEILISASTDSTNWLRKLSIPRQWLVEGIGIHRTILLAPTPAQVAQVQGAMVSENASAVKVSLANLTLNANGRPYAAVLSLGFVNQSGAPWGSEAYIENVWVRDLVTAGASLRPDWGVRLLGNVVEMGRLKVYGCRRGLQVTGTCIRGSQLTLANGAERTLEVLGTSHSLHQVEVEGPGNGVVYLWLTAPAQQSDTSILVAPLSGGPIPKGTVLTFPHGTATLTADALFGATSLSVTLSGDLPGPATATLPNQTITVGYPGAPAGAMSVPLTKLDQPIYGPSRASYAGTTVWVASPGALATEQSLPVAPLPQAIPAGTTLSFTRKGLSVGTAHLTADAPFGATALTVSPLNADIPAGDPLTFTVAPGESFTVYATTDALSLPAPTAVQVTPLPAALGYATYVTARVMASTGAAQGATSMEVAPLPMSIPAGTYLEFSSGAHATTTGNASTGAKKISVDALSATVPAAAYQDFGTPQNPILVMVRDLGAPSGSTVIPVVPLEIALSAGTQLTLGGVPVTLSANAVVGDTTLAVNPTGQAIPGPSQAPYVPHAPVYIDAAQTDISGMLISCAKDTYYPALVYLSRTTPEATRIAGLQVLTRSGSGYGAIINHDGLLFGRSTVNGRNVAAYEPVWFEYDTAVQQPYNISGYVASGGTGEMSGYTLTIRQGHPGMRIVVEVDVDHDITINFATAADKIRGKLYTIVNNSAKRVLVTNAPGVGSTFPHLGLQFGDQRVDYDPAIGFTVAPGATLELAPAQGSLVQVTARYTGRFVKTVSIPVASTGLGNVSSSTAPFAGVQPGDFVEVTTPNGPLTGVKFWGEVLSAGQVTIYSWNYGTGAFATTNVTVGVHVRRGGA
jgi:hypothetical protein